MADTDRKSLLCSQVPLTLTGIDFIQIVDPDIQTVLRVFFIVDPVDMQPPLAPPASLVNDGDTLASGLTVHIVSDESGDPSDIVHADWHRITGVAGLRTVLEIEVAEPGGFSPYLLTIDEPRIDRFFNNVLFSFKQGCPSDFDCDDDLDCPPDELATVQIDYLARDFHSYRKALLDYAAQKYPDWREQLEADNAVMLAELLAYLGDELAYAQDRNVREAHLETATQRRSRSALAALVDYRPDPGQAASAELIVTVRPGEGGQVAEAGRHVWAVVTGLASVPFKLVSDLWTHESWNHIPFHTPDPDRPCIDKGATEAYLATNAPTVAQIDPASPLSPEEFWSGRRMAIVSEPTDPAEPRQAAIVTVIEVEKTVDPLVQTGGGPTEIARVKWLEPLPFAAPAVDLIADLNIVQVVAGAETVERFRVGSDTTVRETHAGLTENQIAAIQALPRMVEREAPFDPSTNARGRILRCGLATAEKANLGWTGPGEPRLQIETLHPDTLTVDLSAPGFVYFPDMIAADANDLAFTLEEGTWREVQKWRLPFGELNHLDYAADEGWTVRFGDGAFGRSPETGDIVQIIYDTGPGTQANLPAGAVSALADPSGGGIPGLDFASAVVNPLPIENGRDEESAESIRIRAPEAYRARPRRAVRPEDYSQIIERMDWVQRANSVTRHTGSWPTDFVSADPLNGFATTPDEDRQLAIEVDCIRQAARDARILPADYIDIDLVVNVCVKPDAYRGEVAERVTKELAAPGFFDPANFTFGQPLSRSALEAAIQCVEGVRAVEDIQLRRKRRPGWHPFTEPELTVGHGQIIRLQNDPDRPSRGTLRVETNGGA
jgi:hypothetical protein